VIATKDFATLGALREVCINGAKVAGDKGTQTRVAASQLAGWTTARPSPAAQWSACSTWAR
jgi:hypothetical protein